MRNCHAMSANATGMIACSHHAGTSPSNVSPNSRESLTNPHEAQASAALTAAPNQSAQTPATTRSRGGSQRARAPIVMCRPSRLAASAPSRPSHSTASRVRPSPHAKPIEKKLRSTICAAPSRIRPPRMTTISHVSTARAARSTAIPPAVLRDVAQWLANHGCVRRYSASIASKRSNMAASISGRARNCG